MNASPHTATPTLSVIDSRGLALRSVGYCRHPDSPVIDSRITRQCFDAAGRLIESWDPRLWGTAPKPNLLKVYGFSGQPVMTGSVDAGCQLSLHDQAGSLSSFWDARGSQRHTDYDDQQRPIAVTERVPGEASCVVERMTYGGSDPAFAQHNQCGQLTRHDNPAGTQVFPDYGLAGAPIIEEQRLLTDLETPNWPTDPVARDALLEDQSYVTQYTFHPTGEIQQQIDAMGNIRTFKHDVAGKLSEVWLQLAGEGKPPQPLVRAIHYNADDQVESEIAGNGVVTRVEYGAEDGRLMRLVAAVENQKPLQELRYVYDPVGNIVELEDKTIAVTHFNKQRIDPINHFRYDSTYQLVEAKGWEVSQPSHGPALPELLPMPLDPNQRRNYTQRFEHDRAGNLITRHHSGAPGFTISTSALSNRSLAQRDDGSLPDEADIALGFDACGNQRELLRGQSMVWDARNQLSQVTLVKREHEPDDYECYAYDRPGHRLRKVTVSQASGRTLRSEVRYLPNLEIHQQADGEVRHVISVEAGRNSVRALHWPEGAHNNQLRYSLSDHLGSSTLELDEQADVLTQENYYPFGGTACWAGKSELVAKYKTIRYSGKERDATGLYYYGYRYYAPWLQRWISSDPAGDVDGVNLFRMVRGNPVLLFDEEGLFPPEKVKRKLSGESSSHGDNLILSVGGSAQRVRDLHISNNFSHVVVGNTVISTSRDGMDVFKNEYREGEIVFKENYKDSMSSEYFASDVALVQLQLIRRLTGLEGQPSTIVRERVVNYETYHATKNLEGNDLFNVFLNKTPNGRATTRVLERLNLIAIKVDRFEREEKPGDDPSADFKVSVKPEIESIHGSSGSDCLVGSSALTQGSEQTWHHFNKKRRLLPGT